MSKMLFERILIPKDGLIKGPFGGDIKKSLFVPKSDDAYKVYEQGVVLKQDINLGDYYISKEHFEQKLKRFLVKKGDILMTGAGTLGELITVPENAPKGVINQALLRIRLNEDIITSEFFKYYFKYYIKAIISRINGDSVIPNLPPLSIIKNTEIDIPNLKVQKQIAKVLSSLDSKIKINIKINAELEGMAKTIYDFWFVQFDFPNDKGKPYRSNGGKMVWNEELKREIPEGWEVQKMREVLAIKNGRDHKHLESGIIPVYGSGGIMRYANNSMYDSESILIPRKGTLGNLFYINKPFWCVDTIFYTQIKFPHSCKYLFYTIKAFNISSMNTGTAVPSMTTEILNNLPLIFPQLGTLKAFDTILSPIFQMIDQLKLENQKLTELRDWLLPMLMNGQVKVGDAEKMVEENLNTAAEPQVAYKKSKVK